jgi:hypothetical protein
MTGDSGWLDWKYQEARVRMFELLADAHAILMRRDRAGYDRAIERVMMINPFFYLSIIMSMRTGQIPHPSNPAWVAFMDQERAKLEEVRRAAGGPSPS